MTLQEDQWKQLFEATTPNPIPVDVDQIVSAPSPNRHWKQTMRLPAVVLAIAAAIVMALGIFPSVSPPGSSAFAQALEQIEKIETVSYIQVTYSGETPDKVDNQESFSNPRSMHAGGAGERDEAPEDVLLRTMVGLETQLKDTETAGQDTAYLRQVLQGIGADPWLATIEDLRWIRIKDKHLQRTDNLLPFGGRHEVIDAQANLHVTFDHRRNLRQVLGRQVVFDRENNTRTEHDVSFSPAVDFFKRFRNVPDTAVQLTESREIDGNKVIGFQTIEQHRGTWRRTYWIDAEAKLPLEIITEYESDDARISSSKWVQSHFVYNNKIPRSLFSTATPEGYTSESAEIHGYK